MAMMVLSTSAHVLVHRHDTNATLDGHTVLVWLAGVAVGALVRWEACKHLGVRAKP